MTPEDRILLLYMRQVQWWMDEAALDIPRDAYSVDDHVKLAEAMEQLAHAIRQRLPLPAEPKPAQRPEITG
ncbi:hypothetical protein [Gandjariella thermophila]|uniref:Uncharacterized protein n=1 Tax=Gandjariella thermophila TaxID=1931992 RepID=A0A4D4JE73_9PSEU|nr:hypothetical protein [Gandjariella thermophila]GDY33340.1 hypothetical protein GTS_49730 [Gandjariella thermophila]